MEIPWGPNGKDVYERTYSRMKEDGTYETWPETVTRVVDGNLALVPERYHQSGEREDLIEYMTKMRIIPAGRHLWMSGVPGRTFINNCFVAPWGKANDAGRHFNFMFNQLMQGGGVGSNYSKVNYLVPGRVNLVLACSTAHPDYDEISEYVTDEDVWAQVVDDSREGWFDALDSLIMAFTMPGTRTLSLDLSYIRKRGSLIKTFGGTAAGPEPLVRLLVGVAEILNATDTIGMREAMLIDHLIAQCVVAGNVRRSARMSILHWKHPDINWFINCKAGSGDYWTTNISVEIDDEFVRLVTEAMQGDINRSPEHDKAMAVYAAVVEGMRLNGEPGFWNSSLSNEDEPNEVTATNPCGEIALPEAGVCNLGHVNLAAGMGIHDILWAHRLMARFLVRATFAETPDHEANEVQRRDRRIGLGHFGVHDYVLSLRMKYSDAAFSEDMGYVLSQWADLVDQTVADYAHELRIPIPVKKRTVAPTGTIAKLAGAPEGIHPIFSPYFIRRIRFSTIDPRQVEQVAAYIDKGYHVEPCIYAANTVVVEIPSKDPLADKYGDLVEGSDEISLDAQLDFQSMYQEVWADNAVSYTVNLSDEDSESLYDTLWKYLGELKGTTVFPAKSRPQSPYEKITKEQYLELAAKLGDHVDDGVDEECATGACPIK